MNSTVHPTATTMALPPEQTAARRVVAQAQQVIDLSASVLRYAWVEVPRNASWARVRMALCDHAQLYLGWRSDAEHLAFTRTGRAVAHSSFAKEQYALLAIVDRHIVQAYAPGPQVCIRYCVQAPADDNVTADDSLAAHAPMPSWTLLFHPDLDLRYCAGQRRMRLCAALALALALCIIALIEPVLLAQVEDARAQLQLQMATNAQLAQRRSQQAWQAQAAAQFARQWAQLREQKQQLQTADAATIAAHTAHALGVASADAPAVRLQSVQWRRDAEGDGLWTLAGLADSERAALAWLRPLRTENLQGHWRDAAPDGALAQAAQYAFQARWRPPVARPQR